MFITIGRFIAILFSIGTIIVVYRIGKKIKNRDVGLIAMLFLAFNCFYMRESRFLYYNVPVSFFIMLGFLFILDIFFLGRKRDYILAGLTIGIGTALNYQGIFLIIPFFVAHFFRDKNTIGLSKRIFEKKILLCFASIVLSFILCTPYVLWQFNTFLERLNFNLARLNQAKLFESAPKINGYLDYFLMFFKYDCLFLSLAMLGIWCCIKNKKGILLLSFPLFFYTCYGAAKEVHPEWIVPIIPFLALLAACFLVDLVKKTTFSLRNKKLLLFFSSLVIVIPSLVNIIQSDLFVSQKDIGTIVKRWVAEKLSKETSLLNTDMKLIDDMPILRKTSSVFFIPDFKDPIMNTYKGPTVKVSGRIIFNEHKDELITISLRSRNFYPVGSPDIAIIKLNEPGEYSISAPLGVGELILRASIWLPGDSKKPEYCSNDINIRAGKFDIDDMDILILQPPR
jgi:hypothetical protein